MTKPLLDRTNYSDIFRDNVSRSDRALGYLPGRSAPSTPGQDLGQRTEQVVKKSLDRTPAGQTAYEGALKEFYGAFTQRLTAFDCKEPEAIITPMMQFVAGDVIIDAENEKRIYADVLDLGLQAAAQAFAGRPIEGATTGLESVLQYCSAEKRKEDLDKAIEERLALYPDQYKDTRKVREAFYQAMMDHLKKQKDQLQTQQQKVINSYQIDLQRENQIISQEFVGKFSDAEETKRQQELQALETKKDASFDQLKRAYYGKVAIVVPATQLENLVKLAITTKRASQELIGVFEAYNNDVQAIASKKTEIEKLQEEKQAKAAVFSENNMRLKQSKADQNQFAKIKISATCKAIDEVIAYLERQLNPPACSIPGVVKTAAPYTRRLYDLMPSSVQTGWNKTTAMIDRGCRVYGRVEAGVTNLPDVVSSRYEQLKAVAKAAKDRTMKAIVPTIAPKTQDRLLQAMCIAAVIPLANGLLNVLSAAAQIPGVDFISAAVPAVVSNVVPPVFNGVLNTGYYLLAMGWSVLCLAGSVTGTTAGWMGSLLLPQIASIPSYAGNAALSVTSFMLNQTFSLLGYCLWSMGLLWSQVGINYTTLFGTVGGGYLVRKYLT